MKMFKRNQNYHQIRILIILILNLYRIVTEAQIKINSMKICVVYSWRQTSQLKKKTVPLLKKNFLLLPKKKFLMNTHSRETTCLNFLIGLRMKFELKVLRI